MRKKLLFVTTRLFWPTDEGHKVLLHNYWALTRTMTMIFIFTAFWNRVSLLIRLADRTM